MPQLHQWLLHYIPHRWIRSTINQSSETVSIYAKFNEKIFNATFGILIRGNSEALCFTDHTLQLGVLAVFKFYYWRHLKTVILDIQMSIYNAALTTIYFNLTNKLFNNINA